VPNSKKFLEQQEPPLIGRGVFSHSYRDVRPEETAPTTDGRHARRRRVDGIKVEATGCETENTPNTRFDRAVTIGHCDGLVHPIAFHLGSLTITWYGVMVALGFLTGLWTASRRGVRDGIASEQILDLGPWLIIGAIVGSRLLYVITFWHEQFSGKPITEMFMVWHGGLVFYGGLIGASLACIFFSLLKRVPAFRLGDIMMPSVALGSVFGRIGCLLNGCCYGKMCHLPWAIRFPQGHETYPNGVHPTEIYDALLNLGFYFALAWMCRRKKYDGQVFAAYLIGYAVLRSLVEVFRGDYPPDQFLLGGWATPAQVVSIGVLGIGLVLLWILPRMKPTQNISTRPQS
jgi:phosphatidylglycerol---prolipoprotein diacylglyceryl transferase